MLVNVNKQECKLKVEEGQMPYIVISPQIYEELMAYVEHYDTEVSGFGLVDVCFDTEGGTRYDITDVYLPTKQENGAASTDIGAEVLAEMTYELIKQGVSTDKMRLHWHSHVDMNVFHSGTDTDNYKDLDNKEFLVSLVLNKDREVLGRIDYYKPIKFSISGIAVYIEYDIKVELRDKVKIAIDKLDSYTKEKSTSIITTSELGYNGYEDYRDRYLRDTPVTDSIIITNRQRKQIRKIFGLSHKQAISYEECIGENCFHCAEADMCTEYIKAVESIY